MQNTDTKDEIRIVLLNPLDICNAVTVGNTIKLDINIVPTTLIPKTIVMEVRTDIR